MGTSAAYIPAEPAYTILPSIHWYHFYTLVLWGCDLLRHCQMSLHCWELLLSRLHSANHQAVCLYRLVMIRSELSEKFSFLVTLSPRQNYVLYDATIITIWRDHYVTYSNCISCNRFIFSCWSIVLRPSTSHEDAFWDNVCKNERIGSGLGGGAPAAFPRFANVNLLSYHYSYANFKGRVCHLVLNDPVSPICFTGRILLV